MATWPNVSEKVFAVVQPEKMNTAEHQLGGRVQKERRERALTELRNRLNDAAVNARMSQTELARNARMSRTTVWNALREGGGVPSDKTVAALAEAMRLKQAERKELLDLRRTADEKGQAAVVCRVLEDVPFEADCYVERPEVAARRPDTLMAVNNLAYQQARAGDLTAATIAFAGLLEVRTRELGADHPDTLDTRSNVASLQAKAGDVAGATAAFAQLVEDSRRRRGDGRPALSEPAAISP